MICSDGPEKRFFADEIDRKLKHTKMGTVAMANKKENMNGSQFYITLRDNISYLDKKHTIFGQVVEGLEVLEKINDVSSFFPINRVELLQLLVILDTNSNRCYQLLNLPFQHVLPHCRSTCPMLLAIVHFIYVH